MFILCIYAKSHFCFLALPLSIRSRLLLCVGLFFQNFKRAWQICSDDVNTSRRHQIFINALCRHCTYRIVIMFLEKELERPCCAHDRQSTRWNRRLLSFMNNEKEFSQQMRHPKLMIWRRLFKRTIDYSKIIICFDYLVDLAQCAIFHAIIATSSLHLACF